MKVISDNVSHIFYFRSGAPPTGKRKNTPYCGNYPLTLFLACVVVFKQKVSKRYKIYRLRTFNTTQGGSRQMLRSIKKAFDIIKAEDAETAITVHTIRTWCKQGKVKCLTAGNKVLVDMQSLLDYIAIKEEK